MEEERRSFGDSGVGTFFFFVLPVLFSADNDRLLNLNSGWGALGSHAAPDWLMRAVGAPSPGDHPAGRSLCSSACQLGQRVRKGPAGLTGTSGELPDGLHKHSVAQPTPRRSLTSPPPGDGLRVNTGTMSSGARKQSLYLAAAALRLLLFVGFPGLANLLTGRVEVSTPVTSFKRCKWASLQTQLPRPILRFLTYLPSVVQEGLYLYNHNVSPYHGGVFHQAPLLLPLFSLLPDFSALPIFTHLLYIAVDVLGADALATIADSGEAGASRLFKSPRRDKRWCGVIVAAL